MKVCKKTCVFDEPLSTASEATCSVPPIATVKSNEMFQIVSEGTLLGEEIIYSGMTDERANRAFDGNSLPSIFGATANCHIGIKFADGFVGVL